MLKRSVLRQIQKTLGRYLAIFAIIALGVGFFTGLRVCTDAMLETAGEYLREKSLFDLRLISTLGLTGEDAAAFAALDGVEAAEGSVTVDFLWDGGEADTVLRAHQLLETMNLADLTAGRMPQAPDECLLDAKYFPPEVIGTRLAPSPDNSEDTRKAFACDGYTVVGLANASYYVNYERGTTSLGRGTVAGFVLIPAEGFDTDVYTEIFLSLGDRGDIYSDEYEAAVEEVRPAVTETLEARAAQRRDDLMRDARKEIDDGQAELDEAWATYRTERADAERELADARAELEEARTELNEGKEALEDGRAELQTRRDQADRELASARAELDTGWEQLQQGRSELAARREEAERGFADAQKELDDGRAQLEAGRLELAGRRAEAEIELRYGQADLEAAEAQLTAGQKRLDSLSALYGAASALTSGINDTIRSRNYESPSALMSALASGEDALLNILANKALEDYGLTAEELCAAWAQAEAQLGGPLTGETLASLQAELADARTRYDAGAAQLAAARKEAEDGLAEAERQLDEAEAKLEAGQAELQATRQTAAAAMSEAEAELAEAEETLTAGEREYAAARSEARDAIAAAEEKLADSERQLRDGEAEYADGLREYEDAESEAARQFADAEAELADGERELADAREKLEELRQPSTYVLDRTANVGYASLENDMGIVRGVSRVFPLFFFLVAALVCVTTMTRMVDEQRTQNGVLKALGYGSGAIAGQYLFSAGSASVLGCVAGFLLGSRFLPMALWQVYHIMYSIERPVAFVLDWGLFAACAALYLLCALGATYLVCRRDLREAPAQLIRPKSPPAGKRILIERVKFLWKRVKFLHKVSIRNILRYKKRMVMMILGVGGCTALLLTGFGIRDSIQNILDYQYDEIEIYDCSVSFHEARTEEDREVFLADHASEAADAAFLHVSAMDLTAGGKTLSVNAVVFEEDMDGFVDLHRGETPIPWPGEGETVIDYRLAMDCGLRVGDAITLVDTELRPVTLTVSGIFDNYIYDYAFIRADTFRAQWGEAPEVKTAYLNFPEGADPHAAAAALMGDGTVAAVNVLGDMRERVAGMLSSLDYIVLIVLVCAGALAFIVLYNLTNISINERRREIATLKVLGFYPRESASYVFRENMVLTGVSALVGLPMGYALLWYVMSQIKIGSFYFGCRVAPLSYVLAVALTFVFASVVAVLLYFKLERIDMADSLKAIE